MSSVFPSRITPKDRDAGRRVLLTKKLMRQERGKHGRRLGSQGKVRN
jgi:hypothetical protein